MRQLLQIPLERRLFQRQKQPARDAQRKEVAETNKNAQSRVENRAAMGRAKKQKKAAAAEARRRGIERAATEAKDTAEFVSEAQKTPAALKAPQKKVLANTPFLFSFSCSAAEMKKRNQPGSLRRATDLRRLYLEAKRGVF